MGLLGCMNTFGRAVYIEVTSINKSKYSRNRVFLTLGFFDNRIFLTYFVADCFFHVSTIEFPSGFFDTGFMAY